MARHKFVDMSPRFFPVVLENLLVPGSFTHAAHHLVDALDPSAFEAHYSNDLTGATSNVRMRKTRASSDRGLARKPVHT